jgi:FAD/FMN-containing dehydrogenase
MKRRSLVKGAIATGILSTTTGQLALASLAPAKDALAATRLDGSGVMLSKGAVNRLEAALQGNLLKSSSNGYDAARSLWNAMIDHKPALIARCTSTEDVATAVKFGREHELLTSVRCGGHSFSGKSAAVNGLMIDLSFMHEVDVDVAGKTASVGGGARLGHVDMATLKHNLVTVVGTDSDTGAGGLTLGGGLGRLNRKWGLTIDNLLSAEVVTADGQIRSASAEENPDLFWAIRGGGGNFGVATRFVYQLHDFDPIVYGGNIFMPWNRRHDFLAFINDYQRNLPDEIHLAPILINHPENGAMVGVEVIYAGDHKTGEKLTAPIRQFAKPVFDSVGPNPYADFQTTTDETHSSHYLKSGLVATLDTDTIAAVADEFPTDPGVFMFFQHMGGAVSRVDPQATAFTHRNALYNIGIVGNWAEGDRYQHYRKLVRGHWARLEPNTLGFYTNLMEKDERDTLDNFAVNLARLQSLKYRYDPDNFFRLNANIKPLRG